MRFSFIFLVVIGIFFGPLPPRIMSQLEYTYEQPQEEIHGLAGIIILGGAFNRPAMAHTHHLVYTSAAGRMLDAILLAKKYPGVPLILTGGGRIVDNVASEAEIMADILKSVGFTSDQFVLESQSRNTYENALFLKQKLRPRPTQKWLLVTSAAHMRRAVAFFEHHGFVVVPYPVDYHTRRPTQNLWPGSLFHIQNSLFWPWILHEIYGYWYFKWYGSKK